MKGMKKKREKNSRRWRSSALNVRRKPSDTLSPLSCNQARRGYITLRKEKKKGGERAQYTLWEPASRVKKEERIEKKLPGELSINSGTNAPCIKDGGNASKILKTIYIFTLKE